MLKLMSGGLGVATIYAARMALLLIATSVITVLFVMCAGLFTLPVAYLFNAITQFSFSPDADDHVFVRWMLLVALALAVMLWRGPRAETGGTRSFGAYAGETGLLSGAVAGTLMVLVIVFIDLFPAQFDFGGEAYRREPYWAFLFVLENLLKVLLLDFLEIFDLSISGMAPATLLAKAFTFLLRLAMTLIIADLMFKACDLERFPMRGSAS